MQQLTYYLLIYLIRHLCKVNPADPPVLTLAVTSSVADDTATGYGRNANIAENIAS